MEDLKKTNDINYISLKDIEEQITFLLTEDKKTWTTFYKLIKRVEVQMIWKDEYSSFTQWIKDFAVRNKIHESILWKRKKAGEVYNKYSELMASKGVKVKSLEESNVSDDALITLDKIMKNDPSHTDELAEKVFNNSITRKELREIYTSVRKKDDDVPAVPQVEDIKLDEDVEEKKSSNDVPISTADMINCLFDTDIWIGEKKKRQFFKSSFEQNKIKLLTEFPVYTGTSKFSRRIDLLAVENISTENLWELNIHGVEIKISKGDLLKDKKYTEYTEFVDYLWLAVPEDLKEIALNNKFKGCGLLVVKREEDTKRLFLEVVEKPQRLTPAMREVALNNLVLKLLS